VTKNNSMGLMPSGGQNDMMAQMMHMMAMFKNMPMQAARSGAPSPAPGKAGGGRAGATSSMRTS